MAIYRRNDTWWLDIYAGKPPRRIRKSLKTEDENKAKMMEQTYLSAGRGTSARKQAMQILDAVLPAQAASIPLSSIEAFYAACVRDENITVAFRTLKQRRNTLAAFVGWALRETRATLAADVNNDIAFRYSQHLGTQGLLGKTRNAYIGELSTVWKMLLKRSKVDANPWTGVRVQRDYKNEHTGRAFTDDELKRLFAVCKICGHDWYGVTLAALYTGLRQSDVATLRWTGDPDDCLIVDLKRRRIFGTPGKTDVASRRRKIHVNIPLHKRLYAFLAKLDRTDDFVFPWRATHPASYKARGDDLNYPDIIRKAKIKPVNKSDEISFHCLRHTFVSRLAEAGVAEDVRMRLAGHTNADTHAIYTHDDVSGRRAIDALK